MVDQDRAILKDPRPKKFFLKNTIVYPKNGGAVFTNKKRILAQDSIVDLNTGGYTVIGPVDLQYIYLYFSLIDFRQCYKGTALPTINMDKLKRRWIPLPPIEEQERIVAKIEELLPLVERYDKAWSRLENFNKRFPGDLQKSILQMAIQGKLVEQRREEGTGGELYNLIQAEKQDLIKAGKIKKEKPSPEIREDEIPFEIPESWMWIHLNQIAESGLGKTLDKAKNTGELCPYLCSINVYWNGISLEKVKEARFTEDDKVKYRLQRGDLLICEGGDVGRSAIWDSDEEMYYQNALHRVRFYGHILPQYFKTVIECYKGVGIIDEYSKGMTIKHLVQNALYAMALPLPPLAEQKRIVAKLEEVLPLCDGLRKS